MKVKTFSGYFLISISFLFAMAVLGSLPKTVRQISEGFLTSPGYGRGFMIGNVAWYFVICVLTYYLCRFGVRLTKAKDDGNR